jgi:hypothetical protein
MDCIVSASQIIEKHREFNIPTYIALGTRWRSWLRKVAGSIPDGATFFIDIIHPVDSASNRNEYQEYFLGVKSGRCVGLTTLPPSCADCLEILEPQPPGPLRACPGL